MLNKSKIVAMYLPQYHRIPENDMFWGDNFTDWVSVRNAIPRFINHNQPRIPLGNNYYDLSEHNNVKWQVELAKKYGIDAFCFYHYWFSSKTNLLTKPTEIFLHDKSLDIEFCLGWDNASWKRTWSTQFGNAWTPLYDEKKDNAHSSNGLLIELDYEDKEGWKKHFNYLLPYFNDKRYIKIENQPVFLILNYFKCEILREMTLYWNELARKHGFKGIFFIGRYTVAPHPQIFKYEFIYQPVYSGWENYHLLDKIRRKVYKCLFKKRPILYNYDFVWKKILRQSYKLKDKNVFLGGFVGYDDTPRRGDGGRVVKKQTPDAFFSYMKMLYRESIKQKKELLFLTAWNEWGEGAYLEPDAENKYAYLECIAKIKMFMNW